MTVSNPQDAAAELIQQWSNEPVMLVWMSLTNNNQDIEKTKALLLGTVSTEELTVDASKILNVPESTSLVLGPLDLSKFDFEEGKLFSQPLLHEHVDYKFEPEQPDLQGWHGFSLTTSLKPLDESEEPKARVTILLWPSIEDFQEENSDIGLLSAPGKNTVIFTTDKVPIGIQTEKILEKRYGCSILPVITTPTLITNNSQTPDRLKVIEAIKSLVNQSSAQEMSTSV